MADSSNPENLKAEYGFDRPEMFKANLVGSVKLYNVHVFAVVNKDAGSWPNNVDTEEFSPLVNSLSAAVKDIGLKLKFTVVQSQPDSDSDGDVLIFPQMKRYRGLKPDSVTLFLESVLLGKEVSQEAWKTEGLDGDQIFVCSHANVDQRCGHCGPPLISQFRQEAANRGLNSLVWPCSHIGGHKYAGNVIAYTKTPAGKVAGDWYGYVTPSDVPALLDAFKDGVIIDRLWRGSIDLDKNEQIEAQANRLLQATSKRKEILSSNPFLGKWDRKTSIAVAIGAGALLIGVSIYIRSQQKSSV